MYKFILPLLMLAGCAGTSMSGSFKLTTPEAKCEVTQPPTVTKLILIAEKQVGEVEMPDGEKVQVVGVVATFDSYKKFFISLSELDRWAKETYSKCHSGK